MLPKTITNVEIVKMFKQHLGIKCQRTNLYWYINNHGFPKPLKLGHPKRWLKTRVALWFKQQLRQNTWV